MRHGGIAAAQCPVHVAKPTGRPPWQIPTTFPWKYSAPACRLSYAALLLMLERQQQRLLAFQLKAVDRAIAGSKEIVNEYRTPAPSPTRGAAGGADAPADRAVHAPLRGVHGAGQPQPAELAEHLREAGDSWQKLQGNATAGPQFAMPMPAPVQEWFDRFGQFTWC